MNRFFDALGRVVVRYRWVVVAVWIIGTVIAVRALPSLSSQVDTNNGAFLPASAPSNQAAVLAQPLIGSVTHSQVPIVAVTADASLNSADSSAITTVIARLGRVPSKLSVHFLSESPDGRAAQILFVSSVTPFDQTKSKRLIDDVNTALDSVALPSDLHVYVSGSVATNVANAEQSNKQGKQIQDASILFIIVLLLVIFRALLAPLVTLLPAALVLTVSGSLIGALGSAGVLKVSFFTQILLIVLILGAGTDYGLFLVFRVREQLLAGSEPKAAVEYAVRRVGESIAASAATVIVALLTLLAASFGLYHDLGLPLAIGVATMLLAGLTLLPALLAILGRAVFWPTKTRPRQASEGVWGRVAARLVARPVWTLVVGCAVLGVVALFALGFKPSGFGGDLAAPAGSDAARGNAAVAAHFPQSNANPTNVVMRFSTSVWQDPGQLATATEGLRSSGKFSAISGPLDPNGRPITVAQLRAVYGRIHPYGSAQKLVSRPLDPPPGVGLAEYQVYLSTARFISADGRTVQWETGLAAGNPGATAALNAVPGVRTAVAAVASRSGAVASGVAGEAPALYDVSHISDDDVRTIVPIAIVAIGIVLALVLRSLVAPLYLILSVLLSYLASLGTAVIVFMKIPNDAGIVFLLPFLMFIFLLALGEDYNILVMTRIREEARSSDLFRAVVRAVGVTGPTVTSAGLVLAGSFVVLAVVGGSGQGNGQIRVIGFGLAVGILIDTFVVRTVLVPSTVRLLGRWNWWPSSMSSSDHGGTTVHGPMGSVRGTAVEPGLGDGRDGGGRRGGAARTPGDAEASDSA
ncbi:MAG TPA: MMPL family transporter [Acidimicrobiales bacterium]|nr:MMPL family transporter [Acidimicrobiales bacterium]